MSQSQMVQKHYHLGPLEKEILDYLWNHPKEKLKVAQVRLGLNQAGHNLAYTTVMTIMSRLTDKGLLKRTKSGKAYHYQANCKKPGFIKQLVKNTLDKLTRDYGDLAMAAFIDELDKLPPAERQKLVDKLKSS